MLHCAAAYRYSFHIAVSALLKAGADATAPDRVRHIARDSIGECFHWVREHDKNTGDSAVVHQICSIAAQSTELDFGFDPSTTRWV